MTDAIRPRPTRGRHIKTTLRDDAAGTTTERVVHLIGTQDDGIAVAEHLAIWRLGGGRFPVTLTIEAVDADGNPTEDHR